MHCALSSARSRGRLFNSSTKTETLVRPRPEQKFVEVAKPEASLLSLFSSPLLPFFSLFVRRERSTQDSRKVEAGRRQSTGVEHSRREPSAEAVERAASNRTASSVPHGEPVQSVFFHRLAVRCSQRSSQQVAAYLSTSLFSLFLSFSPFLSLYRDFSSARWHSRRARVHGSVLHRLKSPLVLQTDSTRVVRRTNNQQCSTICWWTSFSSSSTRGCSVVVDFYSLPPCGLLDVPRRELLSKVGRLSIRSSRQRTCRIEDLLRFYRHCPSSSFRRC